MMCPNRFKKRLLEIGFKEVEPSAVRPLSGLYSIPETSLLHKNDSYPIYNGTINFQNLIGILSCGCFSCSRFKSLELKLE
jgi:hypothetical protein